MDEQELPHQLSEEMKEEYIAAIAKGTGLSTFIWSFLLFSIVLAVTEADFLVIPGFLAVVAAAIYYPWQLKRKLRDRTSDALLEEKYLAQIRAERRGRLIGRIAMVVLAIYVLGRPSVREKVSQIVTSLTNDAVCQITKVNLDSKVYVINDEPDAGYEVKVLLYNEGGKGAMKVAALLSTSEGEFETERQVVLEAGESRVIIFDFPQPTINARDITAKGYCWLA